MAEEKEESSTPGIPLTQFFAEIVGVCILVYFIARFFMGGQDGSFWATHDYASFQEWFRNNDSLRVLANSALLFIKIFSGVLILGIAYATIRITEIEAAWRRKINPEEIEEVILPKNERWQRVIQHLSSDAPSDWRLAVLEADIILDDLLDKLGYVGDTIGDKLKKATTGDFKGLDKAWEAHRTRNQIAHEGQNFVLTQREAQRIIGLYEQVFREFDYI